VYCSVLSLIGVFLLILHGQQSTSFIADGQSLPQKHSVIFDKQILTNENCINPYKRTFVSHNNLLINHIYLLLSQKNTKMSNKLATSNGEALAFVKFFCVIGPTCDLRNTQNGSCLFFAIEISWRLKELICRLKKRLWCGLSYTRH